MGILAASGRIGAVRVPESIALLLRDDRKGTTLILSVIWFMLSFGSYGMATWISTLFADVGISNPYAASFIFALANLPGNAASLLYIEVYGRRRLLCGGMVLAAVSVLGFALDTSTPWVVVTCSSLFNAFSVMGWNSLDCLSGEAAAASIVMICELRLLLVLKSTHLPLAESFPTSSRTSAMGILAASGRIGAVSAQFINGSLEKSIPTLIVVTSVCSIVGGATAWLLPYDGTGTALVEETASPISIPEQVGHRKSSWSSRGLQVELLQTLPHTANPLTHPQETSH